MKKCGYFVLALCAAIFLMSPAASHAAKGFYLSGGLGAAVPTMSGDLSDDLDPEAGLGLEIINLGYGITDHFAVGLDWGGAAGGASEDVGDNAIWSQGYLGITGRYSFDNGQQFVPYVEAAFNGYSFEVKSDDVKVTPDKLAAGAKIAVGGNYYFGSKKKWFVAPELSYHWVHFNCDAKVDLDDGDDYDANFDETTSMFMLLVKIGYHWKQ